MGRQKRAIRVLIVDDEEDIRIVLSRVLKRRGFIVSEAENGKEALEKVESVGPDIIILDVIMPFVDGIKVCQILRDNPATQYIPIIFLSAQRSADKVSGNLPGAAIEHIDKPFDIEYLLKRINTLVKTLCLFLPLFLF